jgi:hypothetical protein
MSGSLFAVNDISGFPILEVFSDDRVVMGAYNQNTLIVTGSNIGIRKTTPTLGFALDISGSVAITGSLNVSSGITGSLFGTASYAIQGLSSSFAITASYALNAAGGSGSSGTSGANGSSGTSGAGGSSGTSGTSGSSGTSGVAGSSGTSGAGGSSGTSGAGGSSGTSGAGGSSGTSGVSATISGVDNYLAKYSGSSALTSSIAIDNGLDIRISGSLVVSGSTITNSLTSSFIMLRSPNTSSNASIVFSGSLTSSIRLEALQDGGVSFIGSSGTLFGISDSLSGSLMSVNDISGMPIFEVFSDERVVMGGYNQNVLVVTGSDIGIGKANPNLAFILDVSGSVAITGSLFVSGTIDNVSGSINYVPKFVSGSILRPSNIIDNGTSVGFFKTAPTAKVDIFGPTIMTGSLDIVIDGAAGWNRLIITSSRLWGDTSAYITIGSGSTGIMINNPHIVWNSGNAAAGLRLGRSSGTSTGAWYEVAVGASDDFFIAKNGGRNNAQLYINTAGNMSLGKATASVRLDVNGNVLVSGSTRSPHFSVEPYLGSNPIISFTGSAGSSSIRLETLSDGSVAFIGSSGTLFGVTDSLTGSLMSVSDITGLPIFEVFSNDTIVAGKYGAPAMIISGSSLIATGSIFGTAYFIVVTSSATNITLSLAESGDYFRTTAATAVGIQVPPQSSVAWPSNTEIMFEQAGAGQITFTTGSGVTINSSETLKTQKQYSVVGLKRVASDIWTLTGERELV